MTTINDKPTIEIVDHELLITTQTGITISIYCKTGQVSIHTNTECFDIGFNAGKSPFLICDGAPLRQAITEFNIKNTPL